MSGHSKWATIKRQKGANDQKRGQIFTKLSNAITIAVKDGGGITDPEGNFKLRLAIEAARNANMPKENIERAIERASGKQGSGLEEALYEGFGPGGYSIIIEALTDNKQRTVSDIKMIFNKAGGNLGSQGSVLYQFVKKGVISVEKKDMTMDTIFLMAAESGADDIDEAGDEVLIYTKPDDLAKTRDSLIKQGLTITSAEFVWEPTILVPVTGKEAAEKALQFVEKLESLDDVQKVYTNFDIPDSIV